MNKRWWKLLRLLLAICLSLGMVGCGDAGEDDVSVNTAAKDYVFRETEIDLGNLPIQDIRFVCQMEGRVCVYGMNYGDQGMEEYLVTMNPDGSDVQMTPLHLTNYGSDGGAAVTPLSMPVTEETEGVIAEESSGAEESGGADEPSGADEPGGADEPAVDEPITDEAPTSSTSAFVNGMTSDGEQLYFLLVESFNDFTSGSYEETFYLLAADDQGTELWRQELGRNDSLSMSYFYVGSMVATSQGVLCNSSMDNASTFQIYSAEGQKIKEFTPEGVESGSMFANHKGDVYLQYWTQVGEAYQQVLQKLDLSNGTVSEALEIPGMSAFSLSICRYMFGGSYDLYLTDGLSVYGYNEGDADKTKLMNYIDSDIDNSWMYHTLILSDTEFLTFGMDYEANDYRGALAASRLTKVDPADVVDKTVLKLACYGTMYSLRPDIIAFNKTNETYRIQIEDYSLYAESGDWTSGITRLNNDIIAGKVPDIMYLTTDLPVASYINQGLFADLYGFIDEDPDMKREDFLANILEAFSVDGELYQLVPYFTVRTVVGKAQHVGTEPGWTVDEMIAAMDAMPEGAAVFQEMVRVDFLNNIMNMTGDQFVNWLDATCHFDSPEFVKLLEFCNRFPEEFDYSVYEDEDYWMTLESAYREDRVMLSMMFLNTFPQYQQMKYGTFGEDITMVGFPTTEGNGAIINYEASWAIAATSKHSDGAWEYVRQRLLPENQDDYGYGWPIRVDSLEALAKRAMEKPYYIDENGNKVEYDDTYWIGDKQITIPPMNQAEVDAVMEVLTTVTQVASYNNDLYNIIYEEAQAYFSGQKSAAEVAEIIQSRAWVYVSENQ